MNVIRSAVMTLIVGAAMASTAAMAQQVVPHHPRVNEVNHRLENQQDRTATGVSKDQLNAKQTARDQAANTRIAQRESADEARHGGHLTQREKRNLNKSLNRQSHRIARQRRN